MSYSALLASLASTPKGDDDWHTIFGTLMRQAYNGGARFKPHAAKPSGESQRVEARRRGVSLYRVRVDRGASTGKGPSVRREAMVSATRIAADLRSVGWGGADAAIRSAYETMLVVFTLPPQYGQSNGDLNSFNQPPPMTWRGNSHSRDVERWVTWVTVIVIPEGESNPRVRMWTSNTGKLNTVYASLLNVRHAYDQNLPFDENSDYAEKIVTYEYAGLVHRMQR